ncbi:cytochrome P450 [Calocera cornea HHB12733]|uniref:Cytochrome P450 n=1 Tax=Calocera cornea HHB12733 TaxID=1353952 RepID=A0A165GVH8_9BASI|nr:cytochrome P450 [Calocera cornea HHB12733]
MDGIMTLGGPSLWAALLACISGLLVLFWKLKGTSESSSQLPPGPNPIPVLGNLAPPKDYRTTFKRWADQYGDIMTMKLLGMPSIVLNSRRATAEILEKRAASTFGRPEMVMAQELVGLGQDSGQTSNPKLHKEYRRLFSIAMSPRAVQAYAPYQIQQFRQVALDMLRAPVGYEGAITRAVSTIAYRVAYGYDIKDEDDPMLARANKAMRILEKVLTPGYFLVDVLPFLKYLPEWLPGAGFQRTAKAYKAHFAETREVPFRLVEQAIADGTAKPSFVGTLLEEHGAETGQYGKERIMWSAASIHSAGSDTSAAAIHNFLTAMVLFPETQFTAQAELDSVLGKPGHGTSPPTLADRERLPYCCALVQEVLRWQPVAPFALLHTMAQEEAWEGWALPKGAIILANVWAMSRDERDFPHPNIFDPTRYLPTASSSSKPTFGFGFGRRVCPGQHLAEATLGAAVLTLLWALRVELPAGVNVEWRDEYGVNRPKWFPIEVKERFLGATENLRGSLSELENE